MELYLIKRDLEPYVYGNVEFNPPHEEFYKFATTPQLNISTTASVRITTAIRNLKSDYFSVNLGFVASEAFLNALTCESSNGVSAFPAEISLKSGKPVNNGKKYCFLEFTCRLDCFDFEKSDYAEKERFLSGAVEENELVRSCTAPVLRGDVVNGHSFFFISRTACFDLVVNANVAASLEAAKLEGITLMPFQQASWEI